MTSGDVAVNLASTAPCLKSLRSQIYVFYNHCNSSPFFLQKQLLAHGVEKIYSLEIAIYKQVNYSENSFYVIFSSFVATENGHMLNSHTQLNYLYVFF